MMEIAIPDERDEGRRSPSGWLRSAFLLVAGFSFAVAGPLAAQAALTGIVREDSTARPLEGVEVVINGTPHRALTNADGRYQLGGLPAGMYQVIFRAVGHVPVRMDVLLTDSQTTRANATLVPSVVVLDPIEVTGAMDRPRGSGLEAFEERRRMGFGIFIDSMELRRNEHNTLDDLLVRYPLRIRAMQIRGSTGWFAFGQPRSVFAANTPCLMTIYLDGRMYLPGGLLGEQPYPESDYDLRRLVRPNELAGIEVYRRASEDPAQFGGSQAGCGVIVLWTRRGP